MPNERAVESIEIHGPKGMPRGHTRIVDFWTVRVIARSRLTKSWEVVLPLPEVLEALKSVEVTETDIVINHPDFAEEEPPGES